MATLEVNCHFDRDLMTLNVREFRRPSRPSAYIIEVQNKPRLDPPGVVSQFDLWLSTADAKDLRDKLIFEFGLPEPEPVGKTHGLSVIEGEPEPVDDNRKPMRDESHD